MIQPIQNQIQNQDVNRHRLDNPPKDKQHKLERLIQDQLNQLLLSIEHAHNQSAHPERDAKNSSKQPI